MFILEVISLSLFVMISNFAFVLAFIIIIIILTYPDIDLLGFDFLNRAVNFLSIFEKTFQIFILLGIFLLTVRNSVWCVK